MAGTIAPFPYHQFFDGNGDPLSGGLLFTYSAGTTTAYAAYTSAALSSAHTNPIVMDSAGRPPSPIFLQAASYKFVLCPAGDTGASSPIWTADNVSAVSPFNVDLDITGVAGHTITANDAVYLSDGDGARTAGRWYQADADLEYASVLPRVVGFAITGGAAGETITVRRGGRLESLTGLTAGSVYYVSATAGGITSTAPSYARRVGQADSTTSLVVAAEIVEAVRGYIPLDLSVARELSGSATQNAAANGGLLASDTTPIFQRVNGATDQALRLNWAATNVDELTWSFSYPPDLDDASAVEVHILAASAGATNSPTMGIAYFEGVGDSNAGGSTGAITGTTVAEYSVSITAANIGAHPNFASVSLTPAAHGTDALYLYAIWIEYTRKLKAA